jgi:hypothetical protein
MDRIGCGDKGHSCSRAGDHAAAGCVRFRAEAKDLGAHVEVCGASSGRHEAVEADPALSQGRGPGGVSGALV